MRAAIDQALAQLGAGLLLAAALWPLLIAAPILLARHPRVRAAARCRCGAPCNPLHDRCTTCRHNDQPTVTLPRIREDRP